MSEKFDTIVFNSINVSALTLTFIDIEQVLTVLVLLSALAYNIKKLRSE